MEDSHFIALVDKYLTGQATPTERVLVEKYYDRLQKGSSCLPHEQESLIEQQILQNVLNALQSQKPAPHRRRLISKLIPYSLAASFICVCLTALYFWSQIGTNITKKPTTELTNDVAPGVNKAILTLSNGTQIILDDTQEGKIASEAGIIITKSRDGRVTYSVARSSSETSPLAFNKIETPKGGHYQINLPDGSKVWLNSASSLRFPTRFSSGERRVQLLGEGYFEIASDPKMPFRITTAHQVVEVLGTTFNIQAYQNEPNVETTLVEGAVNVLATKSGESRQLLPGQASHLTGKGELAVVKGDIDQAISWKNNKFFFNDVPLTDILRQLERWYDVKVDYSEIPRTRYNAHLSRTLRLSEVLKILELTGPVKFQIVNKTIVIKT